MGNSAFLPPAHFSVDFGNLFRVLQEGNPQHRRVAANNGVRIFRVVLSRCGRFFSIGDVRRERGLPTRATARLPLNTIFKRDSEFSLSHFSLRNRFFCVRAFWACLPIFLGMDIFSQHPRVPISWCCQTKGELSN